MNADHRAKISASLKAHHATSKSHLPRIRKSGAEHPRWKGGVNKQTYWRIATAAHGMVCKSCGKPAYLVHHRDGNRYNSAVDNLAPLCMGCHLRHHRSGMEIPA
jgi:hypothetical protein